MSNTRKAKGSVDAILSSAKLPEKSVPLCLRGDLTAEFERLSRDLTGSKETPHDRLVGNTKAKEIADRMEALREEMADSTVEFLLRGLNRKAFRQFVIDHAPRPDNPQDKALGINTDTYWDDLVRASIVEPLLSDEQWEALQEALTSAQWMDLQEAAHGLNIDRVSVPFSAAAYQVRQG